MTDSHASENASNPDSLSPDQILNYLPHRYPFLFVDRVISITDFEATAVKNVAASEPYFEGHFPGHPVMPGVLMVESLAQLTGLVELRRRKLSRAISYFAGIETARFRNPVFPGNSLLLNVKITKAKQSLVIADGVCRVGDKVACECTLMLAFPKPGSV